MLILKKRGINSCQMSFNYSKVLHTHTSHTHWVYAEFKQAADLPAFRQSFGSQYCLVQIKLRWDNSKTPVSDTEYKDGDYQRSL